MSAASEDLQVSLGLVGMLGRDRGVVGDEKKRQKPGHSCFPSADVYEVCTVCQAMRC